MNLTPYFVTLVLLIAVCASPLNEVNKQENFEVPRYQRDLTTPFSPVTASHKNKQWIPNNKPESWDDAQKQCGISSLHMPILETGAEITKIQSIWKKIDKSACKGNEFWIGLRKTCSLNFDWYNGQKLSCETRWTENVSKETGNCVTQSVTSDGKIEWHRRSCQDEYCFLCEYSS